MIYILFYLVIGAVLAVIILRHGLLDRSIPTIILVTITILTWPLVAILAFY